MRIIPETANRKDWPRLVRNAVNGLINESVRQLSIFIEGAPLSSEALTVVCPSHVGIRSTSATAKIASTGTATFTIDRIRDFVTTGVGTVVFTASTNGVVTLTDTEFNRNDILKITAPGSPDATLSDILIILRG